MPWPLLLINPAAVVAVMVIGVGGCAAAGIDPHTRAATLAAAAALLAATFAVVPLLRTRWTNPAGPTQAALAALVIHLGVMVVGAVGTLLVLTRPDRLPAVGWLLAAYWATLVGVAVVATRTVAAEARNPVLSPPTR